MAHNFTEIRTMPERTTHHRHTEFTYACGHQGTVCHVGKGHPHGDDAIQKFEAMRCRECNA